MGQKLDTGDSTAMNTSISNQRNADLELGPAGFRANKGLTSPTLKRHCIYEIYM